ncbi:MAG: hypothetical protein PHR82_03000 [Endomicrobiaceae bacterium]|nr:hypothetical protein [Endomicrobiaceae bacterium]
MGLVRAYFVLFNNNGQSIINNTVCKIKKDQGSVPAKANGTKNIRIINSMYDNFFIGNFTNNGEQ